VIALQLFYDVFYGAVVATGAFVVIIVAITTAVAVVLGPIYYIVNKVLKACLSTPSK
jgi:hypothetical protein